MKHLSPSLIETLTQATSKALASYGPEGINVVPVSTLKIKDNSLVLVNYFMGKTITNILEHPEVSLTCWSGFEGLQIKAKVDYQQDGSLFEEITVWAKDAFPDRTVHGVLVLDIQEIFDVSPSATPPGLKIH